MRSRKSLSKNVRPIQLLLLDVDGVMTDGGIYYSTDGAEMKRFNAQDGYGIARALEAGLKLAIISGRTTPIVDARARELNISEVYQGVSDKLGLLKHMLARHSLGQRQAAFMGDDLFDIPLLEAVGLSAAPNNARPEVKRRVDIVTKADGGNGAVREFIDLILRYRQ